MLNGIKVNEDKRVKQYYAVSGFRFEYHTTDYASAERVFNKCAQNCGRLELKEVTEGPAGYYAKSIKIKY